MNASNPSRHHLSRHSRMPRTGAFRDLVAGMTYEVVPLKNLEAEIQNLPDNSRVSVTCSPNKSIEVSLDVAQRLVASGHHPIVHIAARMVEDRSHLARITERLADLDLHELFVIAGDTQEPGDYPDTMSLLRDLFDLASGQIHHVGVGSYPDGHAFISDADLHTALHDKQALFAEAGVTAHVSTQMCFSPDMIVNWLRSERAAGFDLPVHLGVPGVVDRSKLMTMGMRLGVGASLSYLKKNRMGVVKLLTSSSYNPNRLLDPLAPHIEELRIEGLHVFTFNQIAATAAWQRSIIA